MSCEVFIQRSRLGKRIYELKDSTLTISGTFQFKKFEKKFPLGFTSPDYIRVRRRLHYLVQIPIVGVCIGLLALRILSFLPWGLYIYVVYLSGTWIVVSVCQAIRGIPPVEVVVFKNTNGKAQFDLVKEKKQSREFEEFVAKLTSAIRGEVRSTEMQMEIDADLDASKSNSYFWISSLVVGSLWLEISYLKFWVTMETGWDFFTGFLASLIGVGLCIASFAKNEKLRYLSLAGAALTFVHLFFH
jgi:hypothetical protein